MGFKSSKGSKNLNRRLRRPAFDKQSEQRVSSADLPASGPAFFSKNIIQPKLKVGKADDDFEKEADTVADQIVDQGSTKGGNSIDGQQVQRQEKSTDKEEEKVQARPEVQLQKGEEEEVAQRKLEIQRQADQEEEQVQTKPDLSLNAKEKAAEGGDKKTGNDPSMEQLLQQTKARGFPLPDDVRGEMEKEMGADFSRVRIHTGTEAQALAAHFKAQAFTHGCHIYFNQGKYQPGNKAGRRLLAHELTHVIQQKGT